MTEYDYPRTSNSSLVGEKDGKGEDESDKEGDIRDDK